jgi:hypothetical protein
MAGVVAYEAPFVIPGTRELAEDLVMLDGQDHGAPPEVIAPVLTEFFLGPGSLGRPGP